MKICWQFVIYGPNWKIWEKSLKNAEFLLDWWCKNPVFRLVLAAFWPRQTSVWYQTSIQPRAGLRTVGAWGKQQEMEAPNILCENSRIYKWNYADYIGCSLKIM